MDYRESRSAVMDDELTAAAEFRDTVSQLLAGVAPHPDRRAVAAFMMATISFEHGEAFHTLIANGLPSAALPLLRIQFESLTRSLWIHYAASDGQLDELLEVMTPERMEDKRRFLTPTDMIAALRAVPLSRMAAVLLQRFADSSRKPLNAFVHAEILAFQRHAAGYPVELVAQLLKMSSSLSMMAAKSLGLLTGRADVDAAISELQTRFAHAFTELIPLTPDELR